MQTCYNMTPAEQYKYTGHIADTETEDLLRHSAALADLYDIFWDVENAINERKPKAVLALLDKMREVFTESGV